MTDSTKPKMKVRKGDTVLVISGKDKGSKGKVIKTIPETDKIIVEGVNRVKRHTKAGQGARGTNTGGIIVQEAAIHVSNVMVVGEDGKATRVSKRRESVDKRRPDGSTYSGTRGVRVSARTGKDI
ncbi:MAG: 50S ribosomal protein L24 [Candidatus Nanopelagicales bacterium]